MTKLTRKQHLEMANGLREAKVYLAKMRDDCDGKAYFVCNAIERAHGIKKMNLGTKRLLINWIDDQLCETSTVMTWLYLRHTELYRTMRSNDGNIAYSYRHAWVDHMIKVLES